MPTKKPAAARKAAAAPVKTAKTETAPSKTATAAPARRVWTLPIAMLMMILAAGALWLSVHDASNAPQAATPSAMHASMTPEHAAPPARSAGVNATNAAPSGAAASDTTGAHAAAGKPASVTGCLERAGDSFVLKNAEGAAVSKTRSWKSGFLKRSSPSIDLRDAGNTAHLGSHIGQRVTVNGPLADGEMHVQSLHRVAAACQ